jgi:hypothetical protein
MVDILDEVQDELKEQRNLKYLKLAGKYSGYALVAVVVGILSWGQYSDYKESLVHKEGEKYNKALISLLANRHGIETSLKEFQEVFDNSESAYSVLAGFQVAKISLITKDLDKASKTLHKISHSKYASDEYKDYAGLLALVVDHDSNKIETKEFVTKLEKFAQKDTFIKGVSEEFVAAELISMNEFKQAAEYLAALNANTNLPKTAENRVAQLSRLAVKTAE